MQKKFYLFLTCALLVSAANAFAQFDDDEVPVARVPEGGSSLVLIGAAISGLAGLRFYLGRKK